MLISTPNYRFTQIEAADKQLKSTRQFLEEQAIEREHERDDFAREIDRLKGELRDRDKGKSSHELLKKEVRVQNDERLVEAINRNPLLDPLSGNTTKGDDRRRHGK